MDDATSKTKLTREHLADLYGDAHVERHLEIQEIIADLDDDDFELLMRVARRLFTPSRPGHA